MADKTIGFITYDHENTDDKLFVQWSDALDLEPALLEEMLWAGYDAAASMAPPAMVAAAADESNERRLYRAQIYLTRSALARTRAVENTGGGEDYALQDLSRRMWLEARSILRPRTMKGIG